MGGSGKLRCFQRMYHGSLTPSYPSDETRAGGRAETFDAARRGRPASCFSAERAAVLIAALALLAVVITATFLARSRPLAFSSVGRHRDGGRLRRRQSRAACPCRRAVRDWLDRGALHLPGLIPAMDHLPPGTI